MRVQLHLAFYKYSLSPIEWSEASKLWNYNYPKLFVLGFAKSYNAFEYPEYIST